MSSEKRNFSIDGLKRLIKFMVVAAVFAVPAGLLEYFTAFSIDGWIPVYGMLAMATGITLGAWFTDLYYNPELYYREQPEKLSDKVIKDE